jgi:hypothetical protein
MSHSTETTHKKHLLVLGIVMLCIFVLSILIMKFNVRKEQEANASFAQSTLTALHGKEIEGIIKEYWMQLGRADTRKNPSLYYEVAAGELADRLYSSAQKVDYDKEPFITITKSVEITNVQVIDYSPSRFKVTACSKEETEDIKPNGASINPNIFSHCWVFVFVRQDEKWKALGYLSTIDPTSYETAPVWLQKVIGEMP